MVGAAREHPRLGRVELAVEHGEVRVCLVASQDFHRHDERILEEVTGKKNTRIVKMLPVVFCEQNGKSITLKEELVNSLLVLGV